VGDHLASVRRQLGKAERVAPDLPRDFAHIWNAFIELHNARGSGGFGPCAITYSEIAAYRDLTGVDLSPWEVKVIRALDTLYIEVSSQSG